MGITSVASWRKIAVPLSSPISRRNEITTGYGDVQKCRGGVGRGRIFLRRPIGRFSAPGSLGKEEAKAETFHRNPAGNQPRPAELASGRKRVLRGAGATRAAKRRQRVSGSCD